MLAGEADSHHREKRYLRPDGTVVWASLAVMIVREGGEPSHLLAQTIDITDRKVFEEALATSEERFRSLSASAPNGIYAIDVEGRLLYSNDRLVELTGFGHEQLAGTGWLDMIHPDERERVISESGPTAVHRRLATEWRIVRPDGEMRWVRTRASPLYGRNGEPAGFVGALEDVTQRARGRARARGARGGVPDARRELVGLPRAPRARRHLPLRLARQRRRDRLRPGGPGRHPAVRVHRRRGP